MDTTKMKDDTTLPGHSYSLGEMRDTIRKMREINSAFYAMVFQAGMGSHCHAFVEFSGLQAKFIDMAEAALDAGIEFPFANTHSSTSWPMEVHHAAYLGEKFNCIYGFALAQSPDLLEAFNKEAFGEKRESNG